MKKLFIYLTAVLFIVALAAVPSIAGFGAYKVKAKAFGYGVDYDLTGIPNGGAGGISGAVGGAHGKASGFVFGGTVGGDIHVWGGGVTDTTTYHFNVPASLSIGVGSSSFSYATTGGELSTHLSGCYGHNHGHMSGFAAQGTLNGSYVGASPLPMWDTEGFSGGIAGQGSIGGFSGHTGHNGYAFVDINMEGSSYSESYRFIDFDGGSKTEGMGTNVGAFTNVNTYGYSRGYGASVNGGYMVIGGAAAMTVQELPGAGKASASTVGFYTGSGGLNSNYSGSAVGYTQTSIVTFNGMNGSIVHSSAGMSVNSSSSHGQSDLY